MVSACEGLKSILSNMFAWLPRSCITVSSGPSRNRSVPIPFAEIKLPHDFPPYARLKPALLVPNAPQDVSIWPCGSVSPRPDRVVTTITTLVLSPYSAGGAPWITSIDCTESSGIWFEKTLLCWSVIFWPSTENELDGQKITDQQSKGFSRSEE